MTYRSGLELAGVSLWRGGRCLFTDFDLFVDEGRLAVIVGPNGTGKTSLLRLLAGFLVPAEGSIALNGEPVQQLLKDNRADILYHGHVDGLKRDLTVAENIAFYARLAGSPMEPDKILAPLGLADHRDRLVRHLSAGQRRRAALARLRLSAARLWLLDEPFTNLDSAGRTVVANWIDSHLRNSGIVVVATHQVSELDGLKQIRIEL